MEHEEQIYDNPTGWVSQHIHQYLESDGANGHEWRPGVPTLLLTARGRKSGKLRRTALIYGRDGANYVVVASKGGAAQHPNWYLNLRDNPGVEVQVFGDKFNARAHTATPQEKARLWPVMVGIWPSYADYQNKTERDIPVVVLTPEE